MACEIEASRRSMSQSLARLTVMTATASVPDPTTAITKATHFVLVGDLDAARAAVDSIDQDALWADKTTSRQLARIAVKASEKAGEMSMAAVRGQKGRNVASSLRHSVFARDLYRCRYAHCRRSVIDDRVLRTLSGILPEELPSHPNWKRGECHPIYWTHTASLEHVQPWALGGENSLDNLATSCSRCNYAKGKATVGQLGWTLDPIPDDDRINGDGDWWGLADLLPALLSRSARI